MNENCNKRETPPPSSRPKHYYRTVYVIGEGVTRRYDDADVCLFDNQLTINEKDGAMAIFNFNNIVGVTCYDD